MAKFRPIKFKVFHLRTARKENLGPAGKNLNEIFSCGAEIF